ncbi:MAG TPA: AAA family ATPase, partial [Candidatus Binatia bacterium]|nr:AAA family ATPase [Candidatus Binatia bacterium]
NARRLWDLAPVTCRLLLDFGPDLLDTFLSTERLYRQVQRVASPDMALLARLQDHLNEVNTRLAPIHVAHRNGQRALFEQVTRVLRALAANRPLLLLLDDLHWADRGSLDLLFHLGRRIDNQRILIVGALRPDEIAGADESAHPLQQILAEFGRIFGSFELNLDQADRNKSQRLSDALLDLQPNRYDAAFRRQMHRLTRGNPLFTLELLRQMRERGELVQGDDGGWCPVDDIDWDILPARVEAVIAGRILQLPDELRQILSMASIEGERFTAEAVAAALQRPAAEVLDFLERRLHRREGLVEAVEVRRLGGRSVACYRFHHHLFQKYLYEHQEPALRARSHQRIAQALETIYQDDLDAQAARLAFHFEQAGLVEESLPYLLRAGEHAKRQSADWEAVQAFRRGLHHLRALPFGRARDRQELDFQAALGAPLVALYGWYSVEAEAAFERARKLAVSLGQGVHLPPILWGLWSYYLVRGRQSRAMAMARQILERPDLDEQPDLFLTGHWTLGISSAVLGQWPQAREHLELAIAGYDELAQRDLTYRYGQSPGVTCLFWLALSLWVLGETEAAFDRCRDCLALADREGHAFSRAFSLACVAGLYAIVGDSETAQRHGRQALRLARAGGYPFLRAMSLIVLGWAAVMSADARQGRHDLHKGLTIMEQSGARLFLPFFLGLAVDAYLHTGSYPAASNFLDQAFTAGRQDGDESLRAHLHQLRARLLAAQAAPASAISAELDRALQVAQRQGATQFSRRMPQLRQQLLGATSSPSQC